jgi:enoyl-CoA hydratase/carnithine racemase
MEFLNKMANRGIHLEKNGNCAMVRIPGPSGGSGWTDSLAHELADVCEDIGWDDQIRVVILVYPGDIFGPCSPVAIAQAVAGLRKPVIAAIQGSALGFGLELALACDIRIGTEGARYGLTQIAQGRMPAAGGTQRLPRLIGLARGMEMILTGDAMDTAEALRSGLVHRVVPAAALLDAAKALAEEMAEKSPLSMNFVKEALNSALDLPIEHGMRMELDLYLLLFGTRDRVEGITAFKEKRKPQFEGV